MLGGVVKVEIYEVDTKMRSRLTRFDYVIYVDMKKVGN